MFFFFNPWREIESTPFRRSDITAEHKVEKTKQKSGSSL